MTTSAKFCLALLISVCMIPPIASATPTPPSLRQATSNPPPAADKQTETPAKPHEPRPNPDAAGKYHVGDGVTAPKLIYSVEPQFSEKARKKKISGNCLVYLTVDTDGKVKDAHVIRSIAETVNEKNRAAALTLDDEAVKAALQYRFEPATFQGKPVPVDLHIEINFQIF